MDAVEVSNVSKSYGQVKALDGVSFSVGRGEVFGLIGPDGAGKTSLFRILCTLLLPDSGNVKVDGYDTVSIDAAVVVGEHHFLDKEMDPPGQYDNCTHQCHDEDDGIQS